MSTEATASLTVDTLGRLEAPLSRQDIHDCLVRFARCMDRFNRELLLPASHPDGIIAAGEFVGYPANLSDWARKLHDIGRSATQHDMLKHHCDIDGDTARCETYYPFAGRNRDETIWLAGGRYVERLERRAGRRQHLRAMVGSEGSDEFFWT